MSVGADVCQRPSEEVRNAENINAVETVASDFYSLLDGVDSESIADEFRIGIHSKTHDFDNHLKTGIFEGINPSDSLAELAEKTTTHAQLPSMAGCLVAAPAEAVLSHSHGLIP